MVCQRCNGTGKVRNGRKCSPCEGSGNSERFKKLMRAASSGIYRHSYQT